MCSCSSQPPAREGFGPIPPHPPIHSPPFHRYGGGLRGPFYNRYSYYPDVQILPVYDQPPVVERPVVSDEDVKAIKREIANNYSSLRAALEDKVTGKKQSEYMKWAAFFVVALIVLGIIAYYYSKR